MRKGSQFLFACFRRLPFCRGSWRVSEAEMGEVVKRGRNMGATIGYERGEGAMVGLSGLGLTDRKRRIALLRRWG